MTCSGIGSLVICEQMLGSIGDDTNPDGTPKCCNKSPRTTTALRRAVEWFARYFAVGVNPGTRRRAGCSITSTAWSGPVGFPVSGFSAATTGIAKEPAT